MGRPYKIKRHKRIYRRSAGSIVLRVVVIVAAIAVLFGLGWALYAPVSEWIAQRQNPQEEQDLTVGSSDPQEQDVQETPVPGESEQEEPSAEAQGVSMTAYLPIETVQDSASFTAALQAAKDAGYDSIMFDLKTDDGTVTYSISYNEATDARVTSQTPVDLNAVAQQILDAGLTPVASIYTFHDHLWPTTTLLPGTPVPSHCGWTTTRTMAATPGSTPSRKPRRATSRRLWTMPATPGSR